MQTKISEPERLLDQINELERIHQRLSRSDNYIIAAIDHMRDRAERLLIDRAKEFSSAINVRLGNVEKQQPSRNEDEDNSPEGRLDYIEGAAKSCYLWFTMNQLGDPLVWLYRMRRTFREQAAHADELDALIAAGAWSCPKEEAKGPVEAKG